MAELEKPTPDGHVRLYLKTMFPEPGVDSPEVRVYYLKDVERISTADEGVHILFETKRYLWPWHMVYKMETIHNSTEYWELLAAWKKQEHQKHLDDEYDPNCSMCLAEQVSQPFRVYQVPPQDMCYPIHDDPDGDPTHG